VRENPDDFDLQLLDQNYAMLRPEEHTAMVPHDERERLENLFEVIEIAFSDMDDQAAMERHCRKLAGYLGAADLREALRADRTWFAKAADALEDAARVVLRLVRPRPEDRYVTRLDVCIKLHLLRPS
jgi:hypothetical protein